MSQTPDAIESEFWTRFHRLLLSALPMRGLSELLPKLASYWHQESHATAAFVSVRVPQKKQLWGSLASRGRKAKFVEVADQSGQWNGNGALAAVESSAGLKSVHKRETLIVPFSDDRTPDAGIVLFFEPGKAVESPFFEVMASVCGKLIEQAQWLEQAAGGGEALNALEEAKLRALAEFAAGAGHEIHNPLATISGRAELLLKDETDPDRRQALSTIGGQAYRVRDMIGDLMLFARPPQPEPQQLDLAELLPEVLEPLVEQAQSRGCWFELNAESPVNVWADRSQLCVVVSNLVHNSMNALAEGGPIAVAARSVSEGRQHFGLLTVTDAGAGLSELDREHLFDPFYSGRQAGRGLGFGLSKCWQIVSNHGGRIEFDSVPYQETTFKVFWPSSR